MKLELLDAYHIRVHLCSSIIVFAPLAITVFFCFESMSSLISSSIHKLSSDFTKTDLSKETSVQKLCSTVPHA